MAEESVIPMEVQEVQEVQQVQPAEQEQQAPPVVEEAVATQVVESKEAEQAVPVPALEAEPAPQEPKKEETVVAEPQAEASATLAKKCAVAKRHRRGRCPCAECKTKTKAASVVLASNTKKRVTQKALQVLVQSRHANNQTLISQLFNSSNIQVINDFGDVRYTDCTLVRDIGPFKDKETVETIDWVGSANVILISKSGKVGETVAIPLMPATIESNTPMPL